MVFLWTFNNMAKNKKTLKQNILITGGSGFIGSALTKYLVENNHNVIVYDNNSRGNLRRLKTVIKKIKFIKGDIRDKKKLFSIKQKVDTIIHLAYVNGTEFFYKKPFEILDIAVNGLINILDLSKKKMLKIFILHQVQRFIKTLLKSPQMKKKCSRYQIFIIQDIHMGVEKLSLNSTAFTLQKNI